MPKVLALVAPVGYGKTVQMSTLLADLRRTGRQCIWLTLDERDTHIEHLACALESLLHVGDTSIHPMQALFRGQVPAESLIDALVDRINGFPLPVTLFIDNLNCCTDPSLGPLLDRLVFHTRPTVQWVLSSTRSLPLDVSRAQLQGLIRAAGPTDLSFDPRETGRLLGAELCRRIGSPGVEQVARVTEGWPAAVRLAQIILSDAEHPLEALAGFGGTDQALAHLLNRQVLSGFPPEVRDFLCCIAQLRTFCLDLCMHVSGNTGAPAHLAYLIDRNVFLIPLDRNREWYRLHGLFREFVLREAEGVLSVQRRHDMLTRAAHWCESHGYWREAMDYALASGAQATAVRLLEHIALPFVRDRGQTLQYIEWLEALHAQGLVADPEAEYWFAWALAFRRRYDYARQQCAKLAARVQQQARGAELSGDLERRIAILRASIDSLSDRLLDAQRGAAQWLAGAGGPLDDPFNVTAAHCIEACALTNAQHFVQAHQAIQAARETAFQAHSAHANGWVSAYAALVSLGEGDHATAYRELVAALATSRAALGDDAGICGTLALVAAKCAVEMGLDEEARQLLDTGLKTSRTHGFLEAVACGLEAAIKLWDGHSDQRATLAMLREVASCYPPRLSLMLSCFVIQRLLTLGRIDDARDEAERSGLHTRPLPQPTEATMQLHALMEATRIELLIAEGQLKPAAALIAAETRRAKSAHCAGQLVELSLRAAKVAVRSSEQAQAVRHVTRAVALAATRAIVRPFRDQADCLAAVVADTKLTAWGFATVEERRFFADRCRTLHFADSSLHDRLATLHDEEPQLLAQLTSRELELLGYIDAGLSNQQIADRVGVSLTTVKWHLQNLYAKLAVKSRSAALARARVLNLLTR